MSVQEVGDKDLTDVEDCQHTPGCKIMMIMFILIIIIMEWNYLFKLVRTNEHVPQTFLSDVYNVKLHDTVVNICIPKLCKQVLSIILVTHFKGCYITIRLEEWSVCTMYAREIYLILTTQEDSNQNLEDISEMFGRKYWRRRPFFAANLQSYQFSDSCYIGWEIVLPSWNI